MPDKCISDRQYFRDHSQVYAKPRYHPPWTSLEQSPRSPFTDPHISKIPLIYSNALHTYIKCPSHLSDVPYISPMFLTSPKALHTSPIPLSFSNALIYLQCPSHLLNAPHTPSPVPFTPLHLCSHFSNNLISPWGPSHLPNSSHSSPYAIAPISDLQIMTAMTSPSSPHISLKMIAIISLPCDF